MSESSPVFGGNGTSMAIGSLGECAGWKEWLLSLEKHHSDYKRECDDQMIICFFDGKINCRI